MASKGGKDSSGLLKRSASVKYEEVHETGGLGASQAAMISATMAADLVSPDDDDDDGGGGAGGKKKGESTNRRHRHNESERVRMRTIAAKIAEMKALMEETGIVVPKEKAKILTGAVEYIKHLKNVAMQKSVQLSRVLEESTFNASPLPTCVMDAACNYLDSNRHFIRYFGCVCNLPFLLFCTLALAPVGSPWTRASPLLFFSVARVRFCRRAQVCFVSCRPCRPAGGACADQLRDMLRFVVVLLFCVLFS